MKTLGLKAVGLLFFTCGLFVARSHDRALAQNTGTPQGVKGVQEDVKSAQKGEKKEAPKSAPAATKEASSDTVEVTVVTSEGTMTLALDQKNAPVTVKNFLSYVEKKFYHGTIFHRVIKGFMIQGGGFTQSGTTLTEKSTDAPILNEAKNGLKNDKGTIAMARTSNPNSATSQFYINHVDNQNLNYPNPDGHGYAVFGKVTSGMDVLEKIANAPTALVGGMSDVPKNTITIVSITRN